MFNNPTTRAVEHFVPVTSTGTYYNDASNKNLYDSTTLAINLGIGDFGVFAANGEGSILPNQSLNTGVFNISEAPSIYIASGRDVVDPLPITQLPYWRSHTVNSNENIKATFKAYAAPTNDVHAVHGITASDNTDYVIRISYTGRRFDEMYGCVRRNMSSHRFSTPDYTVLGTAEPVDHLIQNLVRNINVNSYDLVKAGNKVKGGDPIVAFAVTTGFSAASPSPDGTIINNLTAGSVLDVVTTANGNWTLTLTADMVTSIKNAATADPNIDPDGDAILTVDLTTAGTTTNGKASAILLAATDWPLIGEDRIPQVKVSINPSLASGFDTSTTVTKYEEAFEGSGVGRIMNLLFKATLAQRLHNLDLFDPTDPQITSPYSNSGKYDVLAITSYGSEQPGVAGSVIFPRVTYVTFESGFDSSAIRGNINTWLNSAGLPSIDTN